LRKAETKKKERKKEEWQKGDESSFFVFFFFFFLCFGSVLVASCYVVFVVLRAFPRMVVLLECFSNDLKNP